MTDSRSYAGTDLTSDHRLALTELDTSNLYLVYKGQPRQERPVRPIVDELAKRPRSLREYLREFEMADCSLEGDPHSARKNVLQNMQESALKIAPETRTIRKKTMQ